MTSKIDVSFSKSHRVTSGVAVLLKTAEAELPAGVEEADPAGVYARAANGGQVQRQIADDVSTSWRRMVRRPTASS